MDEQEQAYGEPSGAVPPPTWAPPVAISELPSPTPASQLPPPDPRTRLDVPTWTSWSTGQAYAAPPPARRRRWPLVLAVGGGVAFLVAVQFAGGNGGGLYAGFQDPDGPAPTPVSSRPGYDHIDSPGPGVGETSRPTSIAPSPLAAGSSKDFAYLSLQADGVTPVTWSPCRPIHYVVRREGEPAGGVDVLQSAVDEISKATGLTFVFDGRTSEPLADRRNLYQPKVYGERWAPVLIAWTEPGTDEGLAGDNLAWAEPYSVVADDGDEVDVSGEIHVDSAVFADELAHGEQKQARATLLHELGHLVGLDHVSNRALLMNPDEVEGVDDFTAEEKRGLASLGAGACHRDA
ncbi:MAG TPA: hypothetical protein VFL59_00600 [Candidatus Nanopelagicales bacterium]|nr:hypothetical protein [Candidatus Nanopelagicales bacterium]